MAFSPGHCHNTPFFSPSFFKKAIKVKIQNVPESLTETLGHWIERENSFRMEKKLFSFQGKAEV